jgi:hypothetical protein
LETPEGWEKNKDITPLWLLLVPPVALLFGGVIYNLAIEGWDLGWIFLLFVALLVTIAIYTSIANSLRFRGSVTRVFRLMDYERLPILKVGKILEEDLLADDRLLRPRLPSQGTDGGIVRDGVRRVQCQVSSDPLGCQIY